MTITGIHHITLVCADAQRTTDLYVGVLGLRMIKQTVNFDVPDTYHLYFGDETGSPGSAVTFFEWPDAPRGRPGIGGTHHFALAVKDTDAQLRWKRRLTDLGIPVSGPYDRTYFTSIYFRDPDGVILEIATLGPGMAADEDAAALGGELRMPPPEFTAQGRDEAAIRALTWPEAVPGITPDMALMRGIHHISALSSDIERTHAFYEGLLGIPRVKQTVNYDSPDMPHWYWGLDGGRPGTLITYFGQDPHQAHRVRMGQGQTHHIAFAVPDDDTQLEWREKILRAGLKVTEVRDRVYFKSIYFDDPDGHLIELATEGPGFLVDEQPGVLGASLRLPPWLEANREAIERGLTPLSIPPNPTPEVT